MKKILLFCLLIYSTGFGQNFTISDQHHYGSSDSDNLIKTIKCQDSGFLMVLKSNGSNHDKTQASFGGNDIWVVRLNADKSIRWEKSFGGNSEDIPYSVVELSDENILILGASASGVSGNKTSGNFGSNDYWVLKLNASGTKIWDKSFGSSSYDNPIAILAISPLNYFIAGISGGGVSGSKNSPSYGSSDVWCIGIDSSGTEIWQQAYGGTGNDGGVISAVPTGICPLQNGNVLLLTASNSGVSGVKTSPNYGITDAWVLEINPADGQLIQQNGFGGTDGDYLYQALQIGNTIYLAGSSSSGVSGNKQSVLYGDHAAWLLKLDENLLILSDQCFGGTDQASFHAGITKISNGFVAYGVCDSDENPWVTRAVNGDHDIWFMGFDDAGNYQWNYSFGSATGYDRVTDLIENSPNDYTISFGLSGGAANGDITINGYGSDDAYLLDLTTSLGVPNLSSDSFSIYPNPVTSSFSINGLNESASYEISDLKGYTIESGNYSGAIDTEKFIAGMYTIRIVSGSQTIIKKWIKN
ncbi:MAG: hypothetical protein K0S23_1195 [Fluviicola sp.]|jgi:hypothetical protein|uniref:T9SS type A sorting domain-containing protein n=1 Tax=Fluviicola sp. TaxID=1917219 RepID=UPI00260D3C5C|nr:T9SS type A sorting domain-containing protein [Fluviicola sp.]MDF3026888.1 hypothetical protein [Fluviicola sp.]